MFWIRCGCAGVGDDVLGVFSGVLVKVQVFWSVCWCSGYGESVLEWERGF